MLLLAVGNPKTIRGEGRGYRTFILHLAPAMESGYQTCPMSSAGCRFVCLNKTGRGNFQNTQDARIRKTRLFFEDRPTFMQMLVRDIVDAQDNAKKAGLTPVFRLNGTSDIRWENVAVDVTVKKHGITTHYKAKNLMTAFPHLTFYDYTKLPNRKALPANYSLTFSRSEENEKHCDTAFANGMNVAVVFKGKVLPVIHRGTEVFDGVADDLRFLDPKGVVVGLIAKGKKAQNDTTGFVVEAAS